MHSKKISPHKMANYLNFLTIDLNGTNKMDFEDLKNPKKESFWVTEEMLNNCDINESVNLDSIIMPKIKPSAESNSQNAENISNHINIMEDEQKASIKKDPENGTNNPTPFNSGENQRCEDTIFGELVVAMLKKLNAEDKKRAKKEIMNILL